MRIVTIGGSALVGFVLGYFFTVPILVGLTVIAFVVGVYLYITCKEMASIIFLIYAYATCIAVTAMWVTYYLTTKHTYIGDMLRHYVIR